LAKKYLAFIGIARTYDNINRQEIWKAFRRANVSKGPMEGIKNIYTKCANSMVIDGKKN
jgi:hypothetical protein